MSSLRALLVNDTSLAGHHGSALVSRRARELASEAGIELQTGCDWPSVEKILSKRAADFDLVIVNGEGSLHDDTKSARAIARIGEWMQREDIPAYLINASEENNSARVYRGIAQFRKVFVRDSASQRSLKRVGIKSLVVPDLTLTANLSRASVGEETFVTDSCEPDKTDALMRLAARHKSRMISLRAAPPVPVVGSLARRVKFELKRLGSQFMPRGAYALRYAHAHRSTDEFVDVLSRQARGVVSGRYHGVCMAMRMRLPFLAVGSNTSKSSALLADCGLSHRLIGLDDLEAQRGALYVPPFTDDELYAIDFFLSSADRRARRMFRAIALGCSWTRGARRAGGAARSWRHRTSALRRVAGLGATTSCRRRVRALGKGTGDVPIEPPPIRAAEPVDVQNRRSKPTRCLDAHRPPGRDGSVAGRQNRFHHRTRAQLDDRRAPAVLHARSRRAACVIASWSRSPTTLSPGSITRPI